VSAPLERRYCAIVEYDGTDFLGFQYQAIGRTIQGEIETSIRKVAQTEVRISGAGRTDAGVHATGQVIAFNISWKHSLLDLQRALNAILPPDIAVLDLNIVDQDFHPRFSARSRSYCYKIINQLWPSALCHRYACHVRDTLDVAAMGQASRSLLGSHDFASFGKPTQGSSTIRNVMQAEWDVDGCLLKFSITANAFLYRMVRKIVGSLIQVGLGQIAADEVQQILEAQDLTRSAPAVPAHGLYLVQVSYADDG